MESSNKQEPKRWVVVKKRKEGSGAPEVLSPRLTEAKAVELAATIPGARVAEKPARIRLYVCRRCNAEHVGTSSKFCCDHRWMVSQGAILQGAAAQKRRAA